jgi:hypothetical protein
VPLPSSEWTDWLTNSFFRIRVAPVALTKIGKLSPETQQRLRQMIQDITELADLTPPNVAQTWMSGQAPPLLSLQMGRVCIRYTISEESRTLTVHHVIGEEESEPIGRAG